MRAGPVGDQNEGNILALTACKRDEASCAQSFVVRMGGDNQEGTPVREIPPGFDRQFTNQLEIATNFHAKGPSGNVSSINAPAASLMARSGAG